MTTSSGASTKQRAVLLNRFFSIQMFHYVKYLIKKEKLQKISDNTVIVAQICFSCVILVKEFSVVDFYFSVVVFLFA